jgi:hypothetical protein
MNPELRGGWVQASVKSQEIEEAAEKDGEYSDV